MKHMGFDRRFTPGYLGAGKGTSVMISGAWTECGKNTKECGVLVFVHECVRTNGDVHGIRSPDIIDVT